MSRQASYLDDLVSPILLIASNARRCPEIVNLHQADVRLVSVAGDITELIPP